MNQVANVIGLELTAGPWVYDSHVKKKKSIKEKKWQTAEQHMKDMATVSQG